MSARKHLGALSQGVSCAHSIRWPFDLAQDKFKSHPIIMNLFYLIYLREGLLVPVEEFLDAVFDLNLVSPA